MRRRKSVFLPVFILLAVLTVWLGRASVARADHNDNDFQISSICYSCHVLNALLVDPDTSFITAHTRTLDQMISRNGGVAPPVFGCTFCHNDPTRTTYMRSAFSSFEARPSQHPVDRGFSKDLFTNVTLVANSYTTLYMSNWDNSWTKPSDQLDCIGCHEMAGSYPNHPRPDNVVRVNNPYMLRGGDSSWSPTDHHASNAFCLEVCHSGTAQGTSGYRMGHFGWGAYDNTTGGMPDNTLKEVNGTALKTSKCVDCHETHSSNTKANLMGEQRQSNLNIDAANCTAACHSNADFVAAGHGKPGINYNCANCHNSAVSHRDQSNPKRFSGAESASKATLAQNLASNGRDDDFDGVIDDDDEASFRYSAESICSTLCHSDKHVHQGEIGGTSGSASCLNCHDVHGHGVDNNAMMIRRTIMGKTTYYFATGSDYYRADNNSVCDNPSCHAKPLGNTATAGTILGDIQEHIDVNAGPGTNCGSCHNHSSDTGGSSFAPVCNSCHTYPGQTVLGGTHVLSGVHNKHVAQDNVGGYALSCSTCHYRYNHNQSNVQNASQWTSNFQSANVNIKFAGEWNPKNGNGPLYAGVAADNTLADNVYAPGVGGAGTCAGLYCHGNSSTVSGWPAGINTTPAWNDVASGACGTCHLATAANPPQSFAHRTHADNNLAVGYAISCRKCHYQTTSTGNTITGRGGHLNRESRVSFDATDPLVSSGVYGGTLTVGDSGTTTGNCTNIYCHSPGNRKTPAFDNGALGAPDWKQAGPLACNACHESPPSYAGGNPKANSHSKHSAAPAAFTCQVCHWATTTSDNTIASRAKHVNGEWDAVSEGDPVANPGATAKQQSHAFTYDNGAKTCNTAACHGGSAAVWGVAGPIACNVCHKNTGGAAAMADADDFAWDNGVMSKIRDSEWTSSGHGRTAGNYNSGRSAANFTSCTTHCHTSAVSHNSPNNPFRLTDKATPTPTTDFSDTSDPQSDNKVCLDCHSATGAYPSGSTLHVEQNHYGLKHGEQTDGGSFCWDCHDPHGDANDYMVQDNVTKISDGVFGVPAAADGRAAATFSKTNLNGEAYSTVYDWGDYVDNTNSPPRGLCQVCHTNPPGVSGGTTGGAEHFSPTRFDAAHNKQAGVQGDRCTACHPHNADFTPTCNTCHGDGTLEGSGGMPPHAPSAGSQVWSSSVDNLSALGGVGNHRTGAGIAVSSHTALTCQQCHTSTPGSGATHNVSGQLNATMTNIANHNWYNGAAAAWSDGGTAGATGGVVDDSCTNIDCHAPYLNGNAAASGTPAPYRRYWVNATLWDCYTCHAYDGRTGVGARPRPGGADNTMATGSHGRHVGTSQMTCSRCHDVTGYSATTWPNTNASHKNAFVNWSFALAPNPPGYPAIPANAYTVASGSSAPTDDNTAAGHRAWGTCANIYCHSIVQTTAGGALTGTAGQYATPAWDNGTTGQCGTCHAGDGVSGNATKMASGSHAQHLVSGYAMTCDACHTGSGTGHATHADGIIQVPIGDNTWRGFTLTASATIFDRAAAPGVDNANKTPGAARGRCSNIACHNDGNGGVPRVNPAVWGDASADCGYCHGANAATLSTNAHAKHLQAGYACGACHFDTAVDNTTLRAATGYGLHVNGVRNVVLDNAYDLTPANKADDWASPNCSNVKCHDGNAVAWNGGALSCAACHTMTNNVDVTADVDDFVFDAGAGTMSKVKPSDYAARGHGLASGNLPWTGGGTPSSTFGRAMVCLDCHDATAPHTTDNTAGNFFRLLGTINGQSAAFDNVDTVCDACHTGAAVREHAKAVTGGGGSGWEHTQRCVDCHDVHGEGNILMVHDNIVWQTNGGSTYATSYPNGVPYYPSSRVQVVFSSNAAGSGYASTDNAAPYDGICEVCHTRTAQYQKDASNGKAGPQNHPTDKCTNCHAHESGFKGSGCIGCHGSGATRQYWPATYPGAYPNRAGAHDNHVNTIGSWLYGETSASPGIVDNTAKGTADAKQKAICAWCHPNPGGPRPGTGELAHWDYVSPADVHGDGRAGATASYFQYYNGNLATPGSDNNPVGTYNGATRTCANVRCHNNNATPSGATDWRTPPAWSTTGCDTVQCHATPAASGGHYVHYADKFADPIGAGYPCSECHVIPSSLRHANGLVNLFFGGLEATVGGGNGYYDKDGTGTRTAGDNDFKAYDNVYARTCFNIYCHGGDNAWGGTDNTPVWNDPNTGGCYGVGACHGVYGNAWDYDTPGAPMHEITTGKHSIHFQKYDNNATKISGIGPNTSPHPTTSPNGGCAACHNLDGGNCTGCHGGPGAASRPNGTHADGKVDFRTYYPTDVDDPGTTLAATAACNNCHGTGVGTAKAQWDNATYVLDCLTCHGQTPAYTFANGTGRVAPNEGGDGATYGAAVRGHNRPTAAGAYPVTNNPAANRTCGACHDLTISHIDGTDNTTYAGNRLLGTVNGASGLTTVSGLCAACHTTSGASPATKKGINTHGNAGYPDRLEAVFADRTCDQCHEPHGMVNVTAAPAGVNLWMINPTITVVPGTTVSPVRLFAKSGANSFDNTATTSDLCRACHANASNPGYPMTYNVAGQHAAPGFAGDERGKDCSGCHSHNQDDAIATVDGLMPLACNACHSYPGLDNSASPKQMSAAHGNHVGTPTNTTTNNRAYPCTLCHYNYNHNQDHVSKGAAWPANYYDNVNINFDPSWNPGSTTYRGVPVPTTGNGGTGVCAGLYCHGDSAALSAGWGGSDNTPQWDLPSTAACGTCHDAGTADTTAGTVFATKNHPAHLSAAYGPGLGAFSAGANCAEGTGCHTKYGLTPASLHANNAKNLRSTATDNGEVSSTLSTTQVCRNCHSTFASSAGTGDTLVRTQANWDSTSYKVACVTCHNDAPSGNSPPASRGTANLDGTGSRAPDIDAYFYAGGGHGDPAIDCAATPVAPSAVLCTSCHDASLVHIGTAKDASNPWRLSSATNFSLNGGLDANCSGACHSAAAPAKHTWRVNVTVPVTAESKGAADTHPTSTQAAGTGTRWYQVPADNNLPLQGNLTQSPHTRTGTENIVCVSCHDPHGVGAAALPASMRNFSGANNDNGVVGRKMMRFNFSAGVPTPLCVLCHK